MHTQTHTDTHTQTRNNKQKHTQTQTHRHTHTSTHTSTHKKKHTFSRTNTYTHKQIHTHTHTHTNTHTQTHTYEQAHTHAHKQCTHTHTHTHTRNNTHLTLKICPFMTQDFLEIIGYIYICKCQYSHTHKHTHAHMSHPKSARWSGKSFSKALDMYMKISIYTHIHITQTCYPPNPHDGRAKVSHENTMRTLRDSWDGEGMGWRGCLRLQVISRQRSTNNRALLRKMTYKDKASYGSAPTCREGWLVRKDRNQVGTRPDRTGSQGTLATAITLVNVTHSTERFATWWIERFVR